MERISRVDVALANGHRARYHYAAGWLQPGDRVLDAACGIGYGADILCARGDIRYTGFDKAAVVHDDYLKPDRSFWQVDLDRFPATPSRYDVAVTFETIEHLVDPEKFVRNLTQVTKRTIVASVPTVPSKHFNEFHLHDFGRDDLPVMFQAEGWGCLDIWDQPSEIASIYVFEPL